MALARVKTWGEEALLYDDLNAEFDNVLNNALSLISPLTGTLNCNGNQATNIVPVLKSYTTAAIPSAGTAWRMFGVSDSLGGIRLDNGATMGRLLPYIDVTHPPFNARADGTTDDTAAIQAALTAGATTGVVVFFPPGTYRCTAALVLVSNNHVLGSGIGTSILYWDDDDFNDTGPVVTATGTTGAANVLTSNVAKGATVLPVTDGSVISAGDWLLLSSTANFAGLADSPKGEIVRVKSVATNNVTVASPIFDAYTTATTAQVQKLTMVQNVRLSGFTLRREAQSAASRQGITFDTAAHIILDHVSVEYGTERGIYLRNVVDAEVSHSRIEDSWFAASGTSYNIAIADACQQIRIMDNYLRNARHGFTAGKTTAPGVPRLVLVQGNSVTTENNGVAAPGIDSHIPTEFINFIGNTVHGTSGYGMNVRGFYSQAIGNTIYAPGGIYVEGGGVGAYNIVQGNTIYHGGVSLGNYIDGICVVSDYTIVAGNTIIREDTTQVSSREIQVVSIASGTAITGVQITGNLIVQTNAIAGAAQAILVSGLQHGSITNNHIFYKGNNVAVQLQAFGAAESLDVGLFGNTIIDSQGAPTMANGINASAGSTNMAYGSNRILGNTGAAVSIAVGCLTTTLVSKPEIFVGGSTTIGAGDGSIKMSTGNPGTNTAWIPFTYAGTVYYLPAWTTNAP